MEKRRVINGVDLDQYLDDIDNIDKSKRKPQHNVFDNDIDVVPKLNNNPNSPINQEVNELINDMTFIEEINQQILSQDTPHKVSVDDALRQLIPDYKKDIAITVDSVSLSFDVRKEKIDNLKEYVIRSLKHNKSEKKIIQALDDVSFSIYKGEKIGIIGYNGAGKSTLLKVICGVYKPRIGKITVNGRISPLLGLNSGFDMNFSGKDNIYFNGAILGYDKKFIDSKYDEILEFSELEDYINIPIKNYSNGMLAKLGFSIAAIVEPDILVIDEVLGVGDINFAKKSSAKMRELMNSGCTVILVSHSIPQIRKNCNKVIWMDNGKIKEIGEVNDICDKYIKDAQKANSQQLKNIKLV